MFCPLANGKMPQGELEPDGKANLVHREMAQVTNAHYCNF